MQIVIEINEELYNYMQMDEYDEQLDKRLDYQIRFAIKNSTPLPKGHGRLVDADALEKKMCDREEELVDDRAMWESSAVSVALDMFAPTIVEAER